MNALHPHSFFAMGTLMIVAVSGARAQSVLQSSVIAAGGGTSSSGSISASFTFGQPLIGVLAVSSVDLACGFWNAASIPCRADFNTDGVVDFFDYLDFVDAFSSNSAVADFNGDGIIDFFDYLDFVDEFSIGC